MTRPESNLWLGFGPRSRVSPQSKYGPSDRSRHSTGRYHAAHLPRIACDKNPRRLEHGVLALAVPNPRRPSGPQFQSGRALQLTRALARYGRSCASIAGATAEHSDILRLIVEDEDPTVLVLQYPCDLRKLLGSATIDGAEAEVFFKVPRRPFGPLASPIVAYPDNTSRPVCRSGATPHRLRSRPNTRPWRVQAGPRRGSASFRPPINESLTVQIRTHHRHLSEVHPRTPGPDPKSCQLTFLGERRPPQGGCPEGA